MCVMPEVRNDYKERMTGWHRDAIDRILDKMNAHDPSADLDDIKDVFWTEFKAFQDESAPFDKKNSGTPVMPSWENLMFGMGSILTPTQSSWGTLG